MSSSHGELPNRLALGPKAQIHVLAFAESREAFYRFAFVAIDLPATGAFAILPGVLNEPHHIPQWVAQEDPDFMGKGA